MKSRGEQLENIWHVTCNSHSGNLSFGALVNKTFNKKVTLVVKEFKSSWLEAKLVAKTGRKMVGSGKTRWCSERNKYRRCHANLPATYNIPRKSKLTSGSTVVKFKQKVINLIFDDDFAQKLDVTISILDPVCELLNNYQKSN